METTTLAGPHIEQHYYSRSLSGAGSDEPGSPLAFDEEVGEDGAAADSVFEGQAVLPVGQRSATV